MAHTNINGLLPACQSAYRPFHSTETALVKVSSDILQNMDKKHVTFLVMLDLSAAFDTVDYSILLNILANDFGISGKAAAWLRSYLLNRTQRMSINDSFSRDFNLKCGVPQGSCLGPVLFVLYASRLFNILSSHLPKAHTYADDTQLYLSFKPDDMLSETEAINAMQCCISDVRNWLIKSKLKINDSKTEFLIIGSQRMLSKISINSITVGNAFIKAVTEVRNLGVWFDKNFQFDTHISKICSKSFAQLFKIRQVRKMLSEDACKTLLHAFVSCNLDYCNSLLYGLPDNLITKLQRVQNAAARLVTLTPKFCHISPILKDLHWLPVLYRIRFKVILLVFKALNDLAPNYLSGLLSKREGLNYHLRSGSCIHLIVPRFNTSFGERAFAVAGPRLWNSLPPELRLCPSISIFKSKLKTYLFRQAFNV